MYNEELIVVIAALSATMAALVAAYNYAENRTPSFFDQRLKWDVLLQKYGDQTNFTRHLRMSPSSFNKLLALIRPALKANELQASYRGGLIIPELRLYCCIRWIAGGSRR